MTDETLKKFLKLQENLKNLRKVLVAYSGGVDSTLLLHTAHHISNCEAAGLIIHSPSVPEKEFDKAIKTAENFSYRYAAVYYDHLSDADFRKNPSNRCYYCKKAIFSICRSVACSMGIPHVLDGSNLDDLSDYRPGAKAAGEMGILSPLRDAGLTKEDIRHISHDIGLPTWNKPAAPCLSSRFPYLTEITRDRLLQVEKAEEILHEKGLFPCRARYHGSVIRIEIPPDKFDFLKNPDTVSQIVDQIKKLGFKFVTMDLEGLRSGVFNPYSSGRKSAA
jgi:uncharacterized protein